MDADHLMQFLACSSSNEWLIWPQLLWLSYKLLLRNYFKVLVELWTKGCNNKSSVLHIPLHSQSDLTKSGNPISEYTRMFMQRFKHFCNSCVNTSSSWQLHVQTIRKNILDMTCDASKHVNIFLWKNLIHYGHIFCLKYELFNKQMLKKTDNLLLKQGGLLEKLFFFFTLFTKQRER